VVVVGPLALPRLLGLGQPVHRLLVGVAPLRVPRNLSLGIGEPPLPPDGGNRGARPPRPPPSQGTPATPREVRLATHQREREPGYLGTEAGEVSAIRLTPTATVWGVPSRGRDQRTAMRPTFESIREPFSSLAPPCSPTWG
jgi:hypothetical protein